MSDIGTRTDVFSMTGSSIAHGTFSPTNKSRNKLIHQHFKTEISIEEMTGQSHAYKWGIPGYIISVSQSQMLSIPKISFPKEKGQTYMDRVVKMSMATPDPTHYSKKIEWKGKLGIMQKGERQTFLGEAIKKGAKLPSPNTYSPEKKQKLQKVKFEKALKPSHLADIQYVADQVPGPSYTPNFDTVLNKSKSAKIMPAGKHDQKNKWKIEKNDSPNPLTYTEIEKAVPLIKTNSPRLKFPKVKRTFFTDDAIKKSSTNPSPDRYSSIDESRIHKILAKARRY